MQWAKMVADHPEILAGSTNKYQAWEVTDPERWVPQADPLCPREDDDVYACIEWAGAQPWSNGRIGMVGIFYYAVNQWRVATRRPPATRATTTASCARHPGHRRHDPRRSRQPPAGVFGGRVRLHAGGGRESYLLLPIIPS